MLAGHIKGMVPWPSINNGRVPRVGLSGLTRVETWEQAQAHEADKTPLLGGAGGGLIFTQALKPTPNPSKEGNIKTLAPPTTMRHKHLPLLVGISKH